MSLLSRHVHAGRSKRNDFPVLLHTSALLVIDVQKHLPYQECSYYQERFPTCICNIQSLCNTFRDFRNVNSFGGEVIFTYLQSLTNDGRDISLDYKLSGPTLANIPRVTDTDLFWPELLPDTTSAKGDVLIPKTSCSVFQSTNLNYVLQNLSIQQLIIVGQLTDQCVESAVRDGADLGYFVTVVTDACLAVSEAAHAKGLSSMNGFARSVTTDNLLLELEQSSSRDGDKEAAQQDADSSSKLQSTTTKDEMISFLKQKGHSEAVLDLEGYFAAL